jgi:hypothetical protein
MDFGGHVMATKLSGPVGKGARGNSRKDQESVIELLWSIGPDDGGMRGVTLKPGPSKVAGQCDTGLANAITSFQTFWKDVKKEFKAADGIVSPKGKTIDKLDELAGGSGPAPPIPNPSGFTPLKVLRFQQLMPTALVRGSTPSIVPASAIRLRFLLPTKDTRLVEGRAAGEMFDLLFKIEKNGKTFWVGAAVPAATRKFTKAYIFFHPNTIKPADDPFYRDFGGRWPDVQRFVFMMGMQMAAVRGVPVIVPFMTNASNSNMPATNMFADHGRDTLNDIVTAIQLTLGRSPLEEIEEVGVASFSSGIDHMVDFRRNVLGDNIIREQIDFDSPFQKNKHKTMQPVFGPNWTVTQVAPAHAPRIGWLHLPSTAFKNVQFHKNDTHGQIGFMMFQTMMVMSVVRHPPS